MTETEKTNKKTPTELAGAFLHDLEAISNDPKVEKIGLDIQSPEDLSIAIRLLLRGKNEDDYWQLVEGFHQLSIKLSSKSPKMAEAARCVSGEIMNIGKENLGIDWS